MKYVSFHDAAVLSYMTRHKDEIDPSERRELTESLRPSARKFATRSSQTRNKKRPASKRASKRR